MYFPSRMLVQVGNPCLLSFQDGVTPQELQMHALWNSVLCRWCYTIGTHVCLIGWSNTGNPCMLCRWCYTTGTYVGPVGWCSTGNQCILCRWCYTVGTHICLVGLCNTGNPCTICRWCYTTGTCVCLADDVTLGT